MKRLFKIYILLIMLCLLSAVPSTVYAERIISEKKTNSEYEIVMDGENSLEALVTAVEKSAKALHDSAYSTHVSKYKVRIRIENTGRKKKENKFPNKVSAKVDMPFSVVGHYIFMWAFDSVYLPYTSCNWYETDTFKVKDRCEDNVYDREFTFGLHYFMSLKEERRLYLEMKKLTETFTGSKLQKIQKAYSYITKNIRYSSDNGIPIAQSGIMTYKNKEGICVGKAKLFAELCRLMNIECHVVSGRSRTSLSFHAWNIIKYNKKWYFCDVTNDHDGTLKFFMRGMDWWQNYYNGKFAYDENDYSKYLEYSKILMSKIRIEKENVLYFEN